MKQLDFLAVGDLVTDAFVDLIDAEVNCDIDNENCKISMRFGDKIPYRDIDIIKAVGNSPNASVSASRLGLASGLMTHVGNDDMGHECIETLKADNVATDFVQVEDGQKTNYHIVLRYNAERTILIKHAAFNYDFAKQISNTPAPRWIYFSSVAENAIEYHHQIAEYVKNHDTKLAFQPGTFQIKLGYEALRDVYEACELFFCNKEEARRILEKPEAEIEELLRAMRELGPNIAVITDGPNGAFAFDGQDGWHMPMYPDPAPPVDRTGAGDSFSSTFTVALAMGKSVDEALRMGPINSMSVVQDIGAQRGLLTLEKLEEYLTQAPEDYKATKIF